MSAIWELIGATGFRGMGSMACINPLAIRELCRFKEYGYGFDRVLGVDGVDRPRGEHRGLLQQQRGFRSDPGG
jgi:hypothetical protein